jgi:predicted porin
MAQQQWTPLPGRTSNIQTRPIRVRSFVGSIVLLGAFVASPSARAIDFGPFSLTGFAKAESVRGSNQCPTCQRFANEDKQRFWADELVPGRPYETKTNTVTLFQPYLGFKQDLGLGFKVSGLLSQRWRDGKEDIPGFLYEKNIALTHEDYGSLRIGGMTTRTWALADYPYGTNVNLADAWGSSGAGYGILTNAVRYTSRKFDVLGGDLVLEATNARGNTNFKIHKPKFLEIYTQYHHGDLVIDTMYQDTRNGNPQAWSHGPFTGPTPNAADDSKVGGSGQSIAMAMARYQYDNQLEIQGGIRRNRWSGAYAVITNPASPAQWNNMFNVDWNGTLNGVANPGYPATSVDVMTGMRYRLGKWVASSGLMHLGKGRTNNPSERGQSNSATIGTLGLMYEFGHGVSFYVHAGMVHYAKRGLSPISMPSNSAFTNVDSRVTRNGNWAGLGIVYVF